MHGLIFAEALGIPNVWLHLSDRVAGNGFKFHDWFSTTAKPQSIPYRPDYGDPVSEYVKRTELHDSQIDRSALCASFPHHELAKLTFKPQEGRRFISLDECRKSEHIPIFIISFNRGDYLLRDVNSYRGLSSKVTPVIHDNGSDDASTLDILASLEKFEGIKIIRSSKIYDAGELNEINGTVEDFFSHYAEPSRYVVTDCDIDMSTAGPDALEAYSVLLDLIREAMRRPYAYDPRYPNRLSTL